MNPAAFSVNLLRKLIGPLVIGALAIAPAARAQAAAGVVLPRGTLVSCVLDDSLSWKSASVGDGAICLSNPVSAFGYRNLMPRGAEFLGQINEIKSPKPFSLGNGRISLHFDSIALDAVNEVSMSAKITAITGAGVKLQVDREGNLSGPGLTRWDLVRVLFPGTDIYKLLTLPARRPGPVIRGEIEVTLRLQRALELPAPAAVIAAPAQPAAHPATSIPPADNRPAPVATAVQLPCAAAPGWHCFGDGPY